MLYVYLFIKFCVTQGGKIISTAVLKNVGKTLMQTLRIKRSKNKKKKIVSVGEIVCFTFALLYCILQNSALFFAPYLKTSYLLICMIIFAMLKIFFQRYDIKILVFLSVSAAFAGLISYHAQDPMPLVIVVLIFLLHDVRWKTTARTAFFTLTASIMMLYIGSHFGWIPNYKEIRDGAVRHAFGMTQATVMSDLIFLAAAAYVYLKKKLGAFSVIGLGLAAAIVFHYMNARNDTLGIVLLTAAPFLIKIPHIGPMKTFGKLFMPISYPLFAFAALAITKMYAYNKGMIGNIHLDQLLTGRLQLGYTAFQRYPITWFGQHVIETGGGRAGPIASIHNYFYIDSSYLHILFKFGIVFTVLFMLWICLRIYRLIAAKNYLPAIIVTLVGLETMWEANLFSPLNFTLFMLAANFRNEKADQQIPRIER